MAQQKNHVGPMLDYYLPMLAQRWVIICQRWPKIVIDIDPTINVKENMLQLCNFETETETEKDSPFQ